jgi:hypothetical protein
MKMQEEAAARAEQDRERRALEEQQRAEAAALLAAAEATLAEDEAQPSAPLVSEPVVLEGAAEATPGPVAEEPALASFADINFDALDIPVVVPDEEEEEVPLAMKGKKKAKKGKREVALEQRQAAAKKRKQPVRHIGETVEEDLDWQHLRNVKADEILAEDEIVPVENVEEVESEE